MNGATVHLDSPAKFRSPGSVHVSKDGVPFYQFSKPGGFTFTLPKGTYTVQGGALVEKNLKRRGPSVDLSKLVFPLPSHIRLVFTDNPPTRSIASIDPVKGIVYCVPGLRELPFFCLVFVLLHEVGHYFYRSEEACDRFAAEYMHHKGYNPSQIELASRLTLKNKDRHNLTRNFCLNL